MTLQPDVETMLVTRRIEDVSEAHEFLEACLRHIGGGFHPDDPAAEYVDGAGDMAARTFSSLWAAEHFDAQVLTARAVLAEADDEICAVTNRIADAMATPDITGGWVVLGPDWLLQDGRFPWGVVAQVTGQYSHGPTGDTTREVIEFLLEDPELGKDMRWENRRLVLTSTEDLTFRHVLGPRVVDGKVMHDEFELPSWVWSVVQPEECDRIVGDLRLL